MLPIHIDFLNLHNYEGIYFFIAIFSAIVYLTYLLKKANIDLELMYEAVFTSLLVALISGRLLSFILWDPTHQLLKNPLIFFQPWKGGITVAGGVIGGLVTGYVFAKIKKLDFFYHIQFFIPPILVGHIIGRFGCFLNGDAAGKETSLPWGIIFPKSSAAYSDRFPYTGVPLHPTQLYEILGNVLLLIFILATGKNEWITKRRVVWYALGYSAVRFFVEFLRNDSERWFSVFTTGQQITVTGFLIGIFILIWTIIFDDRLGIKEENIARPKIKKLK